MIVRIGMEVQELPYKMTMATKKEQTLTFYYESHTVLNIVNNV